MKNFLNLLFPSICPGCKKSLLKIEKTICLHCLLSLPSQLIFNKGQLNKRLYGRVNIEEGYAFLLFKRDGITQRLLHALKYKGNKELAFYLGNIFGKKCKEQALFTSVDLIVPIPLHKSKQRYRGYNQSLLIAQGLAEALGVGVDEKSVIKNKKTATQTKKDRADRWKNVSNAFHAVALKLEGKHVLLVDDVMTTGATIESCAQTILEKGATKISVACLASAA